MEKIRWAPKVRQDKIWNLYQSDARGVLDEDLLVDVGYAILARCESSLMIRDGKVACPRCGTVFLVREPDHWGSPEPVPCPTERCGWQVTGQEYHQSIRHRELIIGQAGPAFEEYVQRFPWAKTLQERMLAIDRLIHAFHWDLKAQLPNRPAANNLIEGSLEQVIDLLDQLSYGDDAQAKDQWHQTIEVMWKRRRGQL
jgi:hypothetical protein